MGNSSAGNSARGRVRRTLVWLTAIAALATVAFVPSALAVHDVGLFELDGNVMNEAAPGDDWSNVFAGTSAAFSSVFIGAAAEAPANDTTFFTGGGSKDVNDISQWQWSAGDVAPDKDQITDAYAAAYILNGETYLYFGMDRYSTEGSADIGFWFFQSPVSTNPDGTFSGVHTNGDILILSAFTNGGAVSSIEVYEWVDGDLELITSLTDLADCEDAPAGDDACATVNDVPISVPWAYTPKFGSAGTIPANGFFEGGINLNELFNTSDLPCFSSFLAETRSSSSLSAQLKDFALGSVNSCGKVIINKVAVGGDATFNYSGTGTGIDSSFSITTTGGTGSKTFETNVKPGTKTVTETALAGWQFKTLTCTDPDHGTTVVGATATIDVDPGETVTCTYTNEKQTPALSIVKTSSTQSYDSVGDVITYTIVATNTGNTTLAAVTITDANAVLGTCTPANGTSLAPGATLTCSATHVVTQADIEAGHYLNTACVDDGPGGAAQVCDDVNVPGEKNPALDIIKSPDTQTINSGGTASFTITVTNTGNVTLTDVHVTDAQAPGCAQTSAQLGANATLAPGATFNYPCTLAGVTSSFTNSATATGT